MKRPIAITVTLCLSLSYVSAHAARPGPTTIPAGSPTPPAGRTASWGTASAPMRLAAKAAAPYARRLGKRPDPTGGFAADRQHRRGGPYRGYRGSELVVVPYVGETDAHYNRRLAHAVAAVPCVRGCQAQQIAEEEEADKQQHHDDVIATRETWRAKVQERLDRERESLRSSNGYTSESASSRVTAVAFDRETGEIAWPTVLQAEPFDAGRRQLEDLAAAPLPAGSDAAATARRDSRAGRNHEGPTEGANQGNVAFRLCCRQKVPRHVARACTSGSPRPAWWPTPATKGFVRDNFRGAGSNLP